MISDEAKTAIENMWRHRAKAAGWRPKSMMYKRAECEFFTGAVATINALDDTPRGDDEMSKKVPVIWIMNLLTGQYVVEPEAS